MALWLVRDKMGNKAEPIKNGSVISREINWDLRSGDQWIECVTNFTDSALKLCFLVFSKYSRNSRICNLIFSSDHLGKTRYNLNCFIVLV